MRQLNFMLLAVLAYCVYLSLIPLYSSAQFELLHRDRILLYALCCLLCSIVFLCAFAFFLLLHLQYFTQKRDENKKRKQCRQAAVAWLYPH